MVSDTVVAKASKKKSLLGSRVVSVLLVLVSVMTFLTAKKFIDVGVVVSPQEAQIKKVTKLLNKDPDSTDLRLKLAYSLQQAKQFDEANSHYNEVLKVDPDNQAAFYNLAVIAWECKKEEQAVSLLNQLLKKHPDHTLGAVKIGNIYIWQKKYDDAIKVADSAIKEKPWLVEPHLIKAKALEAKGEFVDASEEYREVLRYVPNHKKASEALDRIN